MSGIRRFVFCDEPTRNDDCTAGPPAMPSEFCERRAQCFGEALGLPYVAVGLALEQCEPTDFVLYSGSWSAFVRGTPTWTEADYRLRAHRTAHFATGPSKEYEDLLENVGYAFGIPVTEMSGKHPRTDYTYFYARRDIIAAAGLPTYELFQSEHYVMATSLPGMSQEEMVALYLRTYWDKLGY